MTMTPMNPDRTQQRKKLRRRLVTDSALTGAGWMAGITAAEGAMDAPKGSRGRGALRAVGSKRGAAFAAAGGGLSAGTMAYRTRKRDVSKSLRPVLDDPYAQHLASLVSKMDADEAEMFTFFTMADVLEQDIERNQRTLQAQVNRISKRVIDRTKHAMLQQVSKTEDPAALEYVEALEEIAKRIADPEYAFWADIRKATSEIAKAKNPYITGSYQFDESDFRRDSKTGRFQAKVDVNADRGAKLSNKQAQNLGIDTQSPAYKRLSPEQKAQYQQEYMKVVNFLNIAQGMGDNDVRVRVQAKDGQYWRKLNGKPKAGQDWNPSAGERVVGVEAIPTGGLTLGGAAFGLSGALGGEGDYSRTGTINRADANFGQFAEDWGNAAGDPNNPNRRLFNRVASTSQFVERTAPNGSSAQIAGRFGRAVGQHGPEAEKVIGPSARKTAYRFRGIEKKPDAEVLRQYNVVMERASRPDALPEADRKRLTARQNRAVAAYKANKAANSKTPVEAVKVSPAEVKTVRDGVERKFMEQVASKPNPDAQRAGMAVLASYLTQRGEDGKPVRGPSRDLYGLQLEAGQTPPSEGFLVDKEGKVVAQAVGYGDDHYLPFNLKQMKSLKGGEYIRTRSVGGPTSEDIYVGLMSGAQRVTVVSRSGTFTIEFADDFKGKRRYNDKALRMTRRYEKLLDAVQSEQVSRNVSVSPEVKRKLMADVENEGAGLSRQDKKAMYQSRLSEYQQELGSERDDFMLYVEEQSAGLDDREKRQFAAQMMNDWDAQNEQKFKLNGNGYRDALKALEEQFPYYIKTSHNPTTDVDRKMEGEKDKGYVEPGRNRPTQANAGWRGTQLNPGTGFISASQANYQRGKYGSASDAARSAGSFSPRPAAAPAAAATTAASTTAAPAQPSMKLTEEKKKEIESKSQANFEEAAVNLIKTIQTESVVGPGALRAIPILGETDETKIRAYFKDPDNVRKTDEALQRSTLSEDAGEVGEALSAYKKAAGQKGRVDYDPKLSLTRSGAPFLFPGRAYDPSSDPSLAEAAATELAEKTPPVSASGISLAEMTDEDLNTEIDILLRVKAGMDEVKGLSAEQKLPKLNDLGIDTTIPGVRRIVAAGDPEKSLNRHAENVQRMRALNLNRGKRSEVGSEPTRTRTLDQRAPERTLGIKEEATRHISALEAAAKTLEGRDEYDETAGVLRNVAREFKEMNRSKEIDEEKYGAAYRNSQDAIVFAYALSAGRVTPEQIEDFRERNRV